MDWTETVGALDRDRWWTGQRQLLDWTETVGGLDSPRKVRNNNKKSVIRTKSNLSPDVEKKKGRTT